MKDPDLYAQILGIRSLWKVTEVKLAFAVDEVSIFVEHDPQSLWFARNARLRHPAMTNGSANGSTLIPASTKPC